MALVQKWPYFHFFFQAIQARKMSFKIFQKEKTPFQAIKTRSSISRIIDIFLKGLTHGLGPKMAIFQPFFYAYRPGKCLYDILERENAFLGYNKKKFKQSKNCHFSKRVTHGFGTKMAIFPIFFFLGNIGQESVFYDILQRKNACLGYKNKKIKKSKH